MTYTITMTAEPARIAYDVHQVIRHRLAWDDAIKRGDVASLESPRSWGTMIGVQYDEPLFVSLQPAAKMEVMDEGRQAEQRRAI